MRDMIINRIIELEESRIGRKMTEKEKMLDRAPLHEVSDEKLLEWFEDAVVQSIY